MHGSQVIIALRATGWCTGTDTQQASSALFFIAIMTERQMAAVPALNAWLKSVGEAQKPDEFYMEIATARFACCAFGGCVHAFRTVLQILCTNDVFTAKDLTQTEPAEFRSLLDNPGKR